MAEKSGQEAAEAKAPPAAPKGGASQDSGDGMQAECRCKEVAKKTPRELLKVALGDLAFWKKK